jgi:hypothetical protein
MAGRWREVAAAEVTQRGRCSERRGEEWRVEVRAVSSGGGVRPFYRAREGAGPSGGGRWW